MTAIELLSSVFGVSSPLWVVIAAFAGGTTGAALVTDVMKSRQKRKAGERAAHRKAERIAGGLDGFARQCANRIELNGDLFGGGRNDLKRKVNLDLPELDLRRYGDGWLWMDSEARQSVRFFCQHVDEYGHYVDTGVLETLIEWEKARHFELKARELGLEALEIADIVRRIYGVELPKRVADEMAVIRGRLKEPMRWPSD